MAGFLLKRGSKLIGRCCTVLLYFAWLEALFTQTTLPSLCGKGPVFRLHPLEIQTQTYLCLIDVVIRYADMLCINHAYSWAGFPVSKPVFCFRCWSPMPWSWRRSKPLRQCQKPMENLAKPFWDCEYKQWKGWWKAHSHSSWCFCTYIIHTYIYKYV